MPWAYLFEVKGIQRYILDTGQRRDQVGGSDVVARLARSDEKDVLSKALALVKFRGEIRQSRRASGAFALVSDDEAALTKVRALWRLYVQVEAPGLEFVDALESGDDDLKALSAARDAVTAGVRDNGVADLAPFGGPAAAFAARTGRPRIAARGGDARLPNAKDLDLVALPQRRRSRAIAKGRDAVAERFIAPDLRDRDLVFPRNFGDPVSGEETEDNPLFPFNPDKPWLAIVHADLSGMGQFFRGISEAIGNSRPDNAAEKMFEISKSVEKAVERAAQIAAAPLIMSGLLAETDDAPLIVPARPVVLGGDDVTIIVRADLAFQFAVDFQMAVERETKIELDKLRGEFAGVSLPKFFTACAGIAYSTGSYPFDAGHKLAEDLCKDAKKVARKHKADIEGSEHIPSALAFYAITSTERESYGSMAKMEATAGADQLTMQPWFAGDWARERKLLPCTDGLTELVSALRGETAGLSSLRAMRGEWFRDREGAQRLWARWREICAQENQGALGKVDEALDRIFGRDASKEGPPPERNELPLDADGRTPLFDALMLAGWEAPE